MKKLSFRTGLILGLVLITFVSWVYHPSFRSIPDYGCQPTILHPLSGVYYDQKEVSTPTLDTMSDIDERVNRYIWRFGIQRLKNGMSICEDMQNRYGVPPAILIAIAIHESGIARSIEAGGISKLAIDGNHHGIKGRGKKWQTTENRGKKIKTEIATFADNDGAWHSYKRCARLLGTRPMYAKATRYFYSPQEWRCMNPETRLEIIAAAQAIISPIYATDKEHFAKVMGYVTKYNLQLL